MGELNAALEDILVKAGDLQQKKQPLNTLLGFGVSLLIFFVHYFLLRYHFRRMAFHYDPTQVEDAIIHRMYPQDHSVNVIKFDNTLLGIIDKYNTSLGLGPYDFTQKPHPLTRIGDTIDNRYSVRMRCEEKYNMKREPIGFELTPVNKHVKRTDAEKVKDHYNDYLYLLSELMDLMPHATHFTSGTSLPALIDLKNRKIACPPQYVLPTFSEMALLISSLREALIELEKYIHNNRVSLAARLVEKLYQLKSMLEANAAWVVTTISLCFFHTAVTPIIVRGFTPSWFYSLLHPVPEDYTNLFNKPRLSALNKKMVGAIKDVGLREQGYVVVNNVIAAVSFLALIFSLRQEKQSTSVKAGVAYFVGVLSNKALILVATIRANRQDSGTLTRRCRQLESSFGAIGAFGAKVVPCFVGKKIEASYFFLTVSRKGLKHNKNKLNIMNCIAATLDYFNIPTLRWIPTHQGFYIAATQDFPADAMRDHMATLLQTHKEMQALKQQFKKIQNTLPADCTSYAIVEWHAEGHTTATCYWVVKTENQELIKVLKEGANFVDVSQPGNNTANTTCYTLSCSQTKEMAIGGFEKLNTSVRAFTKGYELTHPPKRVNKVSIIECGSRSADDLRKVGSNKVNTGTRSSKVNTGTGASDAESLPQYQWAVDLTQAGTQRTVIVHSNNPDVIELDNGRGYLWFRLQGEDTETMVAFRQQSGRIAPNRSAQGLRFYRAGTHKRLPDKSVGRVKCKGKAHGDTGLSFWQHVDTAAEGKELGPSLYFTAKHTTAGVHKRY